MSGFSTEEVLPCTHLWMCMGPPCWQKDSGEISDLTHTLLLNPKPLFFAKSEPWPEIKLSGIEHFSLLLRKKKKQGDTVPVKSKCQQLLWRQGRGICEDRKC